MVKPNEQPQNRLIVALDFDRLAPALRLARKLVGSVGMFKIGKQLFTAEGPRAIHEVSRLGAGVFLDLKYHDIPNTVAGAVAAAAGHAGVCLVNIHTLGGRRMMEAAVHALAGRRRRPKLLGVTLLTSLDKPDLREVGIAGSALKRVVALARFAKKCGLDGVVASPLEVRAIRKACGPDFLIVTPGTRPAASARNDQARTATPGAAIRAGADYLVIGRPITAAKDPAAAARAIASEVAEALASLRSS